MRKSGEDFDSSDGLVEKMGPLSKTLTNGLDEMHAILRSLWSNGGILFQSYNYRRARAKDDLNFNAADCLKALDEIAANRWFPAEIAGCSVQFLGEDHLWEADLNEFQKAIHTALTQGGAYSEGIAETRADSLVRDYLEALRNGADMRSLRFFGLDPGFSSWFYQVAWDFAYVVVNTERNELALVLATDTD